MNYDETSIDHFRLVLDWYKDMSGNKNQSFVRSTDTCDRLGVLLVKSVLFSFIDTTSVYNNLDKLFIKHIEESILFELENLKDLTKTTDNDCVTYPIKETKLFILDKKDDILKIVSALMGLSKVPIDKDDIDLFSMFDYGCSLSFLKQFSIIKLINLGVYRGEYKAEPFTVPVCSRSGFSINFNFLPTFMGTISDPNGISTCFDFVKNISIPNSTTDVYFEIFGSYSIIKSITNMDMDDTFKLLIKKAFKYQNIIFRENTIGRRKYSNIDLIDTMEKNKDMFEKFLSLLVYKNETEKCTVGPITSFILANINMENVSKEDRAIIGQFLANDFSSEELSNQSNKLYSKSLDPKSSLYSKPTNVWSFKNEEEETEEETKEKEPDNKPVEEEPSSDTPSVDGTEKRVVKIKLKKDSYMLKVVPPSENTLDDYLYREEVESIINIVLLNPPEDISDKELSFLREFCSQWLYILDIKSIDRILKDIITILPAPPESSK